MDRATWQGTARDQQPTTHEELKPQFNGPQELSPTNNHVSELGSRFSPVQPCVTVALEDTQSQGTQQNVIPDLEKLGDYKCVLFELLSFGVNCYAAIASIVNEQINQSINIFFSILCP